MLRNQNHSRIISEFFESQSELRMSNEVIKIDDYILAPTAARVEYHAISKLVNTGTLLRLLIATKNSHENAWRPFCFSDSPAPATGSAARARRSALGVAGCRIRWQALQGHCTGSQRVRTQ